MGSSPLTAPMMVVEVILLCLVQDSTSYHVMSVTPHIQYHHSTICATYPFCYQNTAGVWKPLPYASPRFQPLLQRDVAVESSECWMNGYFCRSDASNLIETVGSEQLRNAKENVKGRRDANTSAFTLPGD